VSETEQLAALARLAESLERDGIEYWLFGGWAVDFYAGSVTRAHEDLDVAVWSKDGARIRALLTADGWMHAPEPHEDGYTGYEREGVRLEVAFLERDESGEVRGAWPPGSFENDRAELHGVQVRLVSLRSLKADKSELRDDPVVAAKDRVDTETLRRVT
jgi:ribosomal protein S18 acetylase RimI-like enzyme